MKELSIEDKAKRYDEALEMARKCLDEKRDTCFVRPGVIFPELAESKDERIRKELLESFKYQQRESRTDKEWLNGIKLSEVVAWLEKQGDQESIDKLEPKFKVGDWIVSSVLGTAHIIGVNDSNEYQLEYIDGKQKFSSIDYVNYEYDEWTIADAKDGDVLVFSNDTIVIFKDLYNSSSFHSYCHIEDGEFGISEDDMPDWWEGKGFHPATKEQRELLFQEIRKAGYEWDDETKELRGIEEQGEQPKWSYEDEANYKDIIGVIHSVTYQTTEDEIARLDWLKSLKQRIDKQQ